LLSAGPAINLTVSFDDETTRAHAVLNLAKQYLPVAVEFDGPLTDNDWRLVGPGLVGGATSMPESIFQLPPPHHTPSAEILTRSLSDYVITFAWLAVPDVRDERLDRFEEDGFSAPGGWKRSSRRSSKAGRRRGRRGAR
jgi:hypothetical protein